MHVMIRIDEVHVVCHLCNVLHPHDANIVIDFFETSSYGRI
jgi:hypothetical protein